MEGKEHRIHSQYLEKALQLARRGFGAVSPNPLVGAILVKEGQIIGQGAHLQYGGKHAEALALEDARNRGNTPLGSDLYCTLEPCCFTALGKHQPACTDLLTNSGIKTVYLCTLDPNPLVRGRGVEALQTAGIEVQAGFLIPKALRLNPGFFTYHALGRPFVHVKIAQSVDGRIAALDGDSRWITDEAARRQVHRWRANYDAVLVGKNTVQVDDPELSVRFIPGRNPFRIVLDSQLELPLSRKIFRARDIERTIVVAYPGINAEKLSTLRALGVQVIILPPRVGDRETSTHPSLKNVLRELGKLGIRSILVEGGASIFTSFLMEGLFDRVSFFIAPKVLGRGIESIGDLGIRAIEDHLSFESTNFRRIGNQIVMDGYRPGFHRELLDASLMYTQDTLSKSFIEKE